MYIICTYDIKEKRCPKVMKVLRRYMFHVQKSVFEGELTPAKNQSQRILLYNLSTIYILLIKNGLVY